MLDGRSLVAFMVVAIGVTVTFFYQLSAYMS